MHTASVEHEVEENKPVLKVSDRCDRCHAQAFVHIQSLISGNDLMLCGHHYAEYEQALDPQEWVVYDERWRINRKPNDFSEQQDEKSERSPF